MSMTARPGRASESAAPPTVSMKADSHAFEERGHRPFRDLRVSELRSQVGNFLPGRLEISIGCGSRLGDSQDLGLEPLNELKIRFGPGMKLLNLLGVPGPLGFELGLEFGAEPIPMHTAFRPGRLDLATGQLVLFVEPAAFIDMCLLGTDKCTLKLVNVPTQLFAFQLKLLLAPGQIGAKLIGLGRVHLSQGGQPLQLIDVRGKLAVSLTKLLGKHVAPLMLRLLGPCVIGYSLS